MLRVSESKNKVEKNKNFNHNNDKSLKEKSNNIGYIHKVFNNLEKKYDLDMFFLHNEFFTKQ